MKEPPPPIQIEGEDEYERDKIIDSRLYYNKLQYRAKWKGYSPERHKPWYPAENLNNAEYSVKQFDQLYPRKQRVDTRNDQQIVLRTSRRHQKKEILAHPERLCRARRSQRSSH